ncbi:MAG: PH domain-containing protein [Actinobacteria bacterium]|nr:PH domain-containing protein [Actinomycetota bacterium]
MHPLTPLFRGGLALVIVAGIVISNLRERLVEFFLPAVIPDLPDGGSVPGDPVDFVLEHNLVLIVLAGVLVVVAMLIGLFTLSWRFHTLRITGDTVEVRHGVLFRSHRRAPLDRVQGVNLTRPMLARISGMAKLEVIGGGHDSNVKLEYLSTANAERVRADILRLASGRRLAEERARDAAHPESRVSAAASAMSVGITGLILGEDPAEEPESVVSIPIPRLVASHLLSRSTVFLLLLIAAIVWGSIAGTPWVLFSIIPAVLGFGAYWVRTITRSLRYSIAPTRDGVRITFGLFTTVTEILPPGRVHAVEVTQPLLWRPFGWWAVGVNRLSGRAASDNREEQSTRVLPVGSRDDVERVLRLLLPALPENEWPLIFEHGILGPRDGDPYTNTPRRARILRLLSWRRNGFLRAPDVLFVRRGWAHRQLAIFPYERLQSVGIEQGPLARMLGVATVHAHTIAGRVSGRLGAVDRDAAIGLFADVGAAATAAAASDRSHRWAGDVDEASATDAADAVAVGRHDTEVSQ